FAARRAPRGPERDDRRRQRRLVVVDGARRGRLLVSVVARHSAVRSDVRLAPVRPPCGGLEDAAPMDERPGRATQSLPRVRQSAQPAILKSKTTESPMKTLNSRWLMTFGAVLGFACSAHALAADNELSEEAKKANVQPSYDSNWAPYLALGAQF